MKPFDLQRAIAGDPLVTRDGRTVTEFHHFKTHPSSRPCAAVIEGDAIIWVGTDGEHAYEGLGLLMAPKKRTVYVNLYDSNIPDTDDLAKRAAHFLTKESAEENAANNIWHLFATAVPIEIEE